MKQRKVAASILDANYVNLKPLLDDLIASGIDWIHYDVMDGHFVPNVSFGSRILENITAAYDIFIDCHLMVTIDKDINQYLIPYVQAGANSMTLHWEAINEHQIVEFINFCQSNKIKAAIALNPNTAIEVIKPYLNQLDMVLVMSVYPGKGGQKFIETTIQKIRKLKELITKQQSSTLIQVDGGINQITAVECYKNGADVIVVGSYLIKQENILKTVKELKNGK